MRRPRLVGVLINIGQSLLSLDRKADWIMSTLDTLKAADAANAAATATALGAILSLGHQHEADVAALAAKVSAFDDPELRALVDSIQGRTVAMNAAVADLHGSVVAPAGATGAAEGATGAAGAAEPAPAPTGATGA